MQTEAKTDVPQRHRENVPRELAPSGVCTLRHAIHERRRLDDQGALFRPATERLLREAGIGPGFRVLDIGCGTGSLTCLAAELVGPTGEVLGIDRSAEVLTTARSHAAAFGLGQARFFEADLATFVPAEPFDAIVGRLVLTHQPDPVATVRHMTKCVRSGGVVAFAESVCLPHVLGSCRSPLLDQLITWIITTLERAGVSTSIGSRLYDIFTQAGLPAPEVRVEPLIGIGADPLIVRYVVDMMRTLLPLIEQFGVASTAEVGIETLEDRIRQALTPAGVHCGVLLGTAWSRVPNDWRPWWLRQHQPTRRRL